MQQHVVHVGVEVVGAHEANPRPELVDLAVGVDAGIGLADARFAKKRRLATITRARVQFHRTRRVRRKPDTTWSELYEMPQRTKSTARARKSSPLPLPPDRRRFRQKLLAWYRRHGRDLPWRKTDDPYHILVSEIMLQQTQVDRVLPKYSEWLDKYPSLHALAAAPEKDVTTTWYPLGYNIRPKRLQTIAREAVARHDGRLPSDEATLLSFKGIGAYTAGAIRSFAFRQRAAI